MKPAEDCGLEVVATCVLIVFSSSASSAYMYDTGSMEAFLGTSNKGIFQIHLTRPSLPSGYSKAGFFQTLNWTSTLSSSY